MFNVMGNRTLKKIRSVLQTHLWNKILIYLFQIVYKQFKTQKRFHLK